MATPPLPPSRGQLWIHADFEDVLRQHGLVDVEALMAVQAGARLDKPGLARWRERVMLDLDAPGRGPLRLYLKRFKTAPWPTRLRRRLAGFHSFAEQEWHWLRRAAELGIPAAQPVACGARRTWRGEQHSCLLLAEVPGNALERWLPLHGAALDRTARRELIAALAALVQRLHGAGLFHRDLYLSHIFVSSGCDGAWKLFLIDLQRVVAARRRRRRWMVKDLAALHYSSPAAQVTRSERLRWLRHYLGVRRLRPEDRRLVRDVLTKANRVARHSAKHGL